MKKLILLAACALFAASASAQVSVNDFEFGIKGGFNLSTITKSDASTKASFYVGGLAEYRFNSFVGLQAEVVYSRQGAYDKTDGTKTWIRRNYLNVPILAKLYLLDRLNFVTGPQVGFGLNGRVKVKEGSNSVKSDLAGTKGVDFSWALGLSYTVWGNIDVEARYNVGLSKMFKEGKNKNGVFQLGVAYRF